MKRLRYALAVGMLGLLMVVGAQEAQAQCFQMGQAGMFSLEIATANSQDQAVYVFTGGGRFVGQGQSQIQVPLVGGGFLVKTSSGLSGLITIWENNAGKLANEQPLASSYVNLVIANNVVSGSWSRVSFGAPNVQPVITTGTVTACPTSASSEVQMLRD